MGIKFDWESKNFEVNGLTKLVRTVSTMLNHDVASKQKVCEAKALRETRLIELQTNEEIKKVLNGELTYDMEKGLVDSNIDSCEYDMGRIMPTFDPNEYPNTLSGENDKRKDRNTFKAINLAAEILSDSTTEPSQDPVEEDWFFSWREAASGFSSDYMEKLWAEVLAGEVLAPKSFSLRTLEYLKTLSQEEAENINKLSAFIIGGRVFTEAKDSLKANGLDFHECLQLQDLGILQGVGTRVRGIFEPTLTHDKGFVVQIFSKYRLILLFSDVKKTFAFSCYSLTKIGLELMNLSSLPLNNEYLDEVKSIISKEGYEIQTINLAK
ncbi:DUF2806 domain-containing protein [Shewanella gelidii]|uniref:DUF2806 domain-containing protein n=1 Tax=Shewanella gelidii TaxID=1642821 RepID=A0A917NC06_9GAMM|nr:DUF2806 domain-containing protein [Shewanella gelidii]MCL1098077.1 DUF2806 domain-containing protein [Shewanella gelidii]GGI85945.1 hypothetical protein GCM10009332_24100 [Shewanella gelidii]